MRTEVFGKIPSHPEFVAVGSRSNTGRSFDRWLQMANDQLARADVVLSGTPIGFVYRDGDGESLLIGVMVGSRDKVGRKFPLSVFCEFGVAPDSRVSHLAEAFRPTLTSLSMLAMTAMETTPDSLKDAAKRLDGPGRTAIVEGLNASKEAHRTTPLEAVLSRIFVDKKEWAYGINVLLKACAQCRRDGPTRPTAVDATVTSDVELSFWLAAAESQLPYSHGPLAAFWDVPSQRILLVPGAPDSKILVSIASPHTQDPKIWRTETSSAASKKSAWDKLDEPVRKMLEEPGEATIQDFIDLISVKDKDES